MRNETWKPVSTSKGYMKTHFGTVLTIAGAILSCVLPACSKDKGTNSDDALYLADLPGTIAYASDRGGYGDNDWDVYISRFDSEPINITPNSPADDSYPLWIDDGRKLIFFSDIEDDSKIYRINDLTDPEGSLEQIGSLEGHKRFPELSPDGSYVLFTNTSSVGGSAIYKIDLATEQISLIKSDGIAGKAEVKFIDEERVAVASGTLQELNLSTGVMEQYEFSGNFYDPPVLGAFDVSDITGKAYGSLDDSPFGYYRLYSWNYDANSGYQAFSGGPIEFSDMWRDFRVIDLGLPGDYVLQSIRITSNTSATNWKVGLMVGSGAENIIGKKSLTGQDGNNRYADWTSVDHINP